MAKVVKIFCKLHIHRKIRNLFRFIEQKTLNLQQNYFYGKAYTKLRKIPYAYGTCIRQTGTFQDVYQTIYQ